MTASVLLVAATGPLRVRAFCFGFALEPAEVRLPGPGGAAVFRVRRSCRLALRVVDANDRRPLAGVVSAVLRKPGSTTVVTGFGALAPHGEAEFADRLLPGAYDLEVAMRGRRTWRLAGVAWTEAGETREMVVPLEASADLGELALTTVPSPTRPDGRAAFDVIALRRSDVPDAGWLLASSFERQADGTTYAWSDCPPGAYDVLCWRGSPRLVALARGVKVSAGRRTAITLSLAPGIDADLQRELGAPFDLARVEVRSAEAGRLPLMEIGPVWCWLREPGEPPTADPWAVLGPYPTASLEVLVQPVEGELLRLRLTR